MLITFLAVIAPFLVLIPPLQRNRFFILYFAMMMLSAYITENHYFRVVMFSHKAFLVFIVYHLCCINLATFIAYGADKRAAMRGEWRVPEMQLHALEFLGGWCGAIIAQKFFHHKTKKNYFTVGLPLIMLTQIAVIFYILNAGW